MAKIRVMCASGARADTSVVGVDSAAAVEVESLSKHYGEVEAVKGVSFSVVGEGGAVVPVGGDGPVPVGVERRAPEGAMARCRWAAMVPCRRACACADRSAG
ncbi:MAG: hypothetical protein M0Z63_08895 [Actinomycetota bacterium]|jgi:hypothetical protein|nr:hypothetical protein [Actinomycetota bacterium]